MRFLFPACGPDFELLCFRKNESFTCTVEVRIKITGTGEMGEKADWKEGCCTSRYQLASMPKSVACGGVCFVSDDGW